MQLVRDNRALVQLGRIEPPPGNQNRRTADAERHGAVDVEAGGETGRHAGVGREDAEPRRQRTPRRRGQPQAAEMSESGGRQPARAAMPMTTTTTSQGSKANRVTPTAASTDGRGAG